ncbi:unnamed protein product [Hermetia illucens]|uniref:Uncharacterized protein n=3 Tax=Hermetia illucens TaxID=343691 RepID=A0A7R8V1L7_HERIL|nr:unnamed protein product [Hermetia illucens]
MNSDSRTSDSPASTADSTESTSVSVETIVDLNSSIDTKMIEKQTAALANSTNTTNNNFNKNSLTNSQISMISSNDQKDTSPIYNSPELLLTENDTKPVLGTTIEEKVPPKETQLPEKLGGQVPVKRKKSNDFPKHILFGIIQFALSIALVALGGLLLVRGATFATTGCGIWSGAIAAVAGALSVINMRSAQTGFLAVSLICVASGTLALALAGTGLVRDINRLEQEQSNHEAIKAAISANSGLIFALALHLVVSIASVYHSAIKICSR